MRNSMIILKKQMKDTLKNKTIFIQFILFPMMTLLMEHTINMDGMPDLFFTKLFSVMYMGMAPIVSVASIISEEKEKNTLRVLMMANVKPWQYLLGIGVYVWCICMLGAVVMGSGLRGTDMVIYVFFMGIGFVISIIVGACIGMYAKNQMAATSIVMPIMMVLSFVPMLSMFNATIAKFAKYIYTQQMKFGLDTLSLSSIGDTEGLILMFNVILLMAAFIIIYKRKGLE